MYRARMMSWIVTGALLGVGLAATDTWAAKGCYDCHKTKQAEFNGKKFVHDPVRKVNCESCHKRHGFANTLMLVDNSSELCYTCHGDLKAKYASGNVHFPVTSGKCWDCHDPHASDKKGILRAAPEGLDDPGACLMCHKADLSRSLGAAHRHEPFEKQQCLSCHDAHNSPHDGLLRQDANTLCAACHPITNNAFIAAHANKSISGLGCADCHSGHSSAQAGLLSERTHAPFAAGDCESCHSIPDAAGAVTFPDGVTPGSLCVNCHALEDLGVGGAVPHAAVEPDNCLTCHSPHSSRNHKLLAKPQEELCKECHEPVVTGSGLTPHEPAFLGNCAACHTVHGGNHPKLLRATDATLCLDCHKTFAAARDSAQAIHAAIDNCLDCHRPHEGITAAILKEEPEKLCGTCHEQDPGTVKAASAHQPFVKSECASCHLPHYGINQHLVRETGSKSCLACHTDVQMRLSFPSTHPPASDDCLSCHKPHQSDQPHLLTSTTGTLCESCHDYADLELTKPFVHTPAHEGDCTGCHNAHGAGKAKLLSGRAQRVTINGLPVTRTPRLGEKIADLCYTCHDGLVDKFRQQGAHSPVAAGVCDACHAPHGSDHAAFVKDSPAKVCGACHTIDEVLSGKHGGYDLAAANCIDCHNPHISASPKLVRTNAHPPFAENACDGCHSVGPDNRVTLSGAVNEVCATCHDNGERQGTLSSQHAPFAAGECTSCHSAHASDTDNLLKAAGDQLCFACHSDVKLDKTLAVQHGPFSEGKCADCHAPHASSFPHLTTRPPESLCLSCHEDLKKQMAQGVVHKPLAGGQCVACHRPHAGTNSALLVTTKAELCARCHDPGAAAMTAAHQGFPVSSADCQNCHVAHVGRKGGVALLLPDKHKPFAAGPCTQCHAAPGDITLKAPVKDLCLSCHNDLAKDLAQPVVHQPLTTEDGCAACHGPHVGFGKKLLTREGVQTCLSCHNTKEFTGPLQHTVAFEDCTTCHLPHSGPQPKLLTEPDIMSLCLGCHEDAVKNHLHPMGEKATDPRTKQPVNCVGCHSPHSAEFAPLLVADKNRKLCTICHDVSGE